MGRSMNKTSDTSFAGNSFLAELYNKTKPLPFRTESGNECVSINMTGCSKSFLRSLENFITDNSDHFRLVVRGVDYYLEILGRESFTSAYQKSYLRH